MTHCIAVDYNHFVKTPSATIPAASCKTPTTMATEEHLKLSNEIKAVHRTLRDSTRQIGRTKAWTEHLQSKAKLASYAQAMKQLAVEHWEANNLKAPKRSSQRSRIDWIIAYCRQYFHDGTMIASLRAREQRLLVELDIACADTESSTSPVTDKSGKIALLDVGSCYNPFEKCDDFEVCAIDIAPASESVHECDFLNVELCDQTDRLSQSDENEPQKITALAENSFDVIVFSLLLEYLPTSEQRVRCCEKAYKLLRTEGILLIITPDSRHCGANARLMKTWRYTLSLMGFNRIKYEKLEHITCMAFRKCSRPEIGERWARMHKEEYMEYCIEIPQDSNGADERMDNAEKNTNATDGANATATSSLGVADVQAVDEGTDTVEKLAE